MAVQKGKVFKVTVTLEIHGQKSKRAAVDFLDDALHVDGLFLTRSVEPRDMELVQPNKCCVCGTTQRLHKDGWYGYRCDGDGCVPF